MGSKTEIPLTKQYNRAQNKTGSHGHKRTGEWASVGRQPAAGGNGVSEWAARNTAGSGRGPWSVVSRPQQSSLYWALKCILQIARPAILVPIVLA